MEVPSVLWVKTRPEADYSGLKGLDRYGNRWYQPANRETVTVETVDGLTGQGWTAEEAWASIERQRQTA